MDEATREAFLRWKATEEGANAYNICLSEHALMLAFDGGRKSAEEKKETSK